MYINCCFDVDKDIKLKTIVMFIGRDTLQTEGLLKSKHR